MKLTKLYSLVAFFVSTFLLAQNNDSIRVNPNPIKMRISVRYGMNTGPSISPFIDTYNNKIYPNTALYDKNGNLAGRHVLAESMPNFENKQIIGGTLSIPFYNDAFFIRASVDRFSNEVKSARRLEVYYGSNYIPIININGTVRITDIPIGLTFIYNYTKAKILQPYIGIGGQVDLVKLDWVESATDIYNNSDSFTPLKMDKERIMGFHGIAGIKLVFSGSIFEGIFFEVKYTNVSKSYKFFEELTNLSPEDQNITFPYEYYDSYKVDFGGFQFMAGITLVTM